MTPDPGSAEEIRRYQAQYARNPEGLIFARLADAHRKAGEAERALELLEHGLERHPRYLSALVVRGRTLLDLGRREAAIDAFRRVLELDPQNLVALRAVARLSRDADRPARALEAYRQLSELDPLDREVGERLDELERLVAERSEQALSGASGAREPEGEVGQGDDGANGLEGDDEAEAGEAVEGGARSETDGKSAAEARSLPDEDVEAGETVRGDEAVRPSADDEGVVVTATMAELFLRQGLYEQAVRVLERLLERRPGDPLLSERLATARRLSSGDRAAPRPRAGSAGSESARRRAEEAGNGVGSPLSSDSEQRSEPPSPGDSSASAGTGTEARSEPATIREYLTRLLEGKAEIEPGPSASRFARWLRRSGES